MIDTTITRTKFLPTTYDAGGVETAIGLVDKFDDDRLVLMVTCSKVILGGTKVLPAVIISTKDVKELLEHYTVNMVQGLISFALGHEFGHVKQWNLFPETVKPGEISSDLQPEVLSDCYGIRETGIRKDTYHTYMKMFMGMINSRLESSNMNALQCAIVRMYNKSVFKKRMKKVDKIAQFGNLVNCQRSGSVPSSIGKKIVRDIVNVNNNITTPANGTVGVHTEERWIDT